MQTIFSGDSHFIEPPDLWSSRMDARYRDRAPHYEKGDDGTEYLACEGIPRLYFQAGSFFGAGNKPENMPEQYRRGWDAAPKSVWDPAERLREQDADGVSREILYSTVGLFLYGVADADLVMQCFRTFNDWVGEYCRYDPKRLYGTGLLLLDDISAAVSEVERIAKLGLRGCQIPSVTTDDRRYTSREYDPFWAAAQEHGMVLTFHAGSTRKGAKLNLDDAVHDLMSVPMQVQLTLADLVVGGVLERFPKLQFVSAEFDTAWIPHFLYRLDHYYERFRKLQGVDLPRKPSEYLRQSLHMTIQFEEGSLEFIKNALGVDNIHFATDYPHMDSTFPRSREIVTAIERLVLPEEARKIAWENTARLYRMEA